MLAIVCGGVTTSRKKLSDIYVLDSTKIYDDDYAESILQKAEGMNYEKGI